MRGTPWCASLSVCSPLGGAAPGRVPSRPPALAGDGAVGQEAAPRPLCSEQSDADAAAGEEGTLSSTDLSDWEGSVDDMGHSSEDEGDTSENSSLESGDPANGASWCV
jgi:hypothetical protein